MFPEDAKIIDVKRDFGAKGDGETDDTAAIQKAIVASLTGNHGNPKFIYLPEGTYRVSGSLKARITDKPDGQGGWSDGWRCGMNLIGQSRERTVLRLTDQCPGFTDPANPRAMLIFGSTGHGKQHDHRIGGWGNEAFRNHLANLTVDTGTGNPGAVGVDFLASNRGAMEAVTIRSGDPERVIEMRLKPRDRRPAAYGGDAARGWFIFCTRRLSDAHPFGAVFLYHDHTGYATRQGGPGRRAACPAGPAATTASRRRTSPWCRRWPRRRGMRPRAPPRRSSRRNPRTAGRPAATSTPSGRDSSRSARLRTRQRTALPCPVSSASSLPPT